MDSIVQRKRRTGDRVSIHPSSIVEHGAELAPGVEIGPFCTVGPNVVIEAGAKLVSHVVVEGHTRIGEQAQLFPFCTVGLAPQDFKYKGEPTRCEIGARTLVREHCTIHRGTATGVGITRVGSDNLMMAYVHIAHDCQVGNNTIFANNASVAGHVEIGDWVILGGFAGVHQFCKIGPHAMLGMNTSLTQEIGRAHV